MFNEYLFFIFKIIFRSITYIFIKSDLEREVVLLRKELQILKRKKKKVNFTNLDRFFYIAIHHNTGN